MAADMTPTDKREAEIRADLDKWWPDRCRGGSDRVARTVRVVMMAAIGKCWQAMA
jgi:hypothetical protein